ncbi:hypothetical protein CSKR_101247 [Clonorchis sinensis]|uniref:Uncharacterized protein n=1 Tax=Clonorchis sinensis TaxID=79923 RepID=A0A419PCN9_CLOSI|nr:hypothetical protein CSKR_101247 [Clonorchis sinensis]
MTSVLAKLRETGRVHAWQSEEGHRSHPGFPRWQQIAMFRRFPDVEMMGEHYPVRTFVMDKLAAQLRAARVVFGCDVVLCYLYITKAIRKHSVSFNIHVFLVTGTLCEQPIHISPHSLPGKRHTIAARSEAVAPNGPTICFLTYWLYITRKWAAHAQPGNVHFDNVTNNRLENANDRAHHAETVEHAIQKRPSYAVDLDRTTESRHSASRKSVCVRVFGSKEELLNGLE